ncbi:PBP1A family penicillin-binding protein [Bacillus sp. AGMB 02131]|uniref:PBP1A family penicillin-binding protein n=1 Tax=Peribacillus faecalis TaxID=2772559 RepID=A0A927CTS1_9BACI|nr:PBP1A family penicillin-binding protein [Peribacillus faecalis]
MEILTKQQLHKATRFIRIAGTVLALGILALLTCYLCILIYAKILGPPPLAVPQSTIFYSADGTVIGETNAGQQRYWVELDNISPSLTSAVLAIEDQRFYSHNGFDFRRIAGAVIADIKAMAKVQGASTITQQYARNLFLNHEKTWYRKISEAFYTIRIEMNYTKNEILEGYLNTIYYGHGIYGAQAASHYYFGKDAGDLDLSEAAMLAGIPKGPAYYSPFRSYDRAKARQEIVLSEMAEAGYVTKEEAKEAASRPIELQTQKTERAEVAPYYIQNVQQALKNDLQLDEQTIALGGLKVYTTLDLDMQQAAEQAFERIFPENSTIQGALVAIEPKSGYVKALIGGRNYSESSFNRATQAARQPGSTIKPLVYYAALENGFTPATMLKSEPTTFTFDDGKATYSPRNFNSQYADKEITLAQAIALSDNVYAVKTHLFLGNDYLKTTAERFGIKSKIETVPSAALGTSNVKLIEMVNAYGRLANGGKATEAVFIQKVENHQGEVVYEAPKVTNQILDRDQAFVLTEMLTGIFNPNLNGYTTVTGSTIANQLSRQYAGKSGTTNTDSWMIGYTPELVSGIWTGYDKGTEMNRSSESQYAKKIWADFMETSLANSNFTEFEPPDKQLIKVKIDPESGKIAGKTCTQSVSLYFIDGTEPNEKCSHETEKEETDKEKKKPWYKRLFPFF